MWHDDDFHMANSQSECILVWTILNLIAAKILSTKSRRETRAIFDLKICVKYASGALPSVRSVIAFPDFLILDCVKFSITCPSDNS